jgi:hypothetical protein
LQLLEQSLVRGVAFEQVIGPTATVIFSLSSASFTGSPSIFITELHFKKVAHDNQAMAITRHRIKTDK